MKINKNYKIELILILATLMLALLVIGYYRPLVISPINNFVTQNNSVVFSFEKANYILIDDNSEFSSPERIDVKNDLIVNFEPGVYYWKIGGIVESETRKLIIQSRLDLQFREQENNFEVVNTGNEKLSVEVYNQNKISGNVILDVGEGTNLSGEKYLGRKYE